jgi:hypothetical protein
MHSRNTCDIYMCRLRHINDSVLFFITKPCVGVLRVMAEIRNQNLQAQMGMLTTTTTRWEPRNTFEV